MVDRTSLEFLGFIFGCVTALVIAIAVIVVRSNVDAKATIEQSAPVVPVTLSAQR